MLSVLDVGTGTGFLALLLAEMGQTVTNGAANCSRP